MTTNRRFPSAIVALLTLVAAPQPSQAGLFAWGSNSFGQVGDATTFQRNEPIAVYGALAGKTVTAIAAGQGFSLALTVYGKVFGWGNNGNGQLGDGTNDQRLIPVAAFTDGALAGRTITAISAGRWHSLALTSAGEVFAATVTFPGATPVQVIMSGALAGKTVVAIAAGAGHSLALTSDGIVFAWGYNGQGALGDATGTSRDTPVQVSMSGALAGKTVVAIAAGAGHSFALTSEGKLFGWGANNRGQLGDGTTNQRNAPVAVRMDGPLEGKIIASISTSETDDPDNDGHSLALTTDGQLLAWGDNSYGQLGDGTTTTRLQPVVVNTGSALAGKTIIAAGAGYGHSMVLTVGGQVFGWGYNGQGQLGDGTTTNRSLPVAAGGVLAGEAVSTIAVSGSHCLALAGGLGPAEIAIEHPVATNLFDGAASVAFGAFLTGVTASRTFTIRNKGGAALTGLGVTIDGASAADFTVTASPSALLAFGTATTITVRFAPESAGTKTAVLHVASNDADEDPFDITLTGLALAPEADADSDGVTNAAEVNLAALGFDPLTDNTALRTLLHNNATGMSLYKASDIQALALGSPILERNATTGNFSLRLGVEQSPDLTNWTALPGTIDFNFTPAGPAPQFFRVLGEKP